LLKQKLFHLISYNLTNTVKNANSMVPWYEKFRWNKTHQTKWSTTSAATILCRFYLWPSGPDHATARDHEGRRRWGGGPVIDVILGHWGGLHLGSILPTNAYDNCAKKLELFAKEWRFNTVELLGIQLTYRWIDKIGTWWQGESGAGWVLALLLLWNKMWIAMK